MKKLPTALTVPSRTLKVWLIIAVPLEASVEALGKRGAAAPGVGLPGVVVPGVAAPPDSVVVSLPNSK
jgi:hypothetical protein